MGYIAHGVAKSQTSLSLSGEEPDWNGFSARKAF